MQTFIPYSNFIDSLKVLDYKRLGKQRVEARTILDNLLKIKVNSWKNHIVAKIWEGYEASLAIYYNLCLNEWVSRGYKNNMPYYKLDTWNQQNKNYPWWLGDIRLHVSHRIRLLQKNFTFYKDKFNIDSNAYDFILSFPSEYWWPISTKTNKNETFNIWNIYSYQLAEELFPDLLYGG